MYTKYYVGIYGATSAAELSGWDDNSGSPGRGDSSSDDTISLNFLRLFANPRHFLVIARLDQRHPQRRNHTIVPRDHRLFAPFQWQYRTTAGCLL